MFKIYKKNHHNQKVELVANPENLTLKYWSLEIMNDIMNHNNTYREKRYKQDPDLRCWKDEKESAPVTLGDLYQFIAIIYYMGIVKLSYKDNYWSNMKYMPTHQVCLMFHMNRHRFKFIWRHFHVNCPSIDENTEQDEELNGFDDLILEDSLNQMEQDIESDSNKEVWFDNCLHW